MLYPGPSRKDADRFAAETWGAIAAGLGGRLFESLRSKRSLAYTVIANSWQRQRAGGLLTYIATETGARLDEARDAMLEELAIFHREAPSLEELERATEMACRCRGNVEAPEQRVPLPAGIADALAAGERGSDELDDRAASYRAVTAESVLAVTARSLDPAARAKASWRPQRLSRFRAMAGLDSTADRHSDFSPADAVTLLRIPAGDHLPDRHRARRCASIVLFASGCGDRSR